MFLSATMVYPVRIYAKRSSNISISRELVWGGGAVEDGTPGKVATCEWSVPELPISETQGAAYFWAAAARLAAALPRKLTSSALTSSAWVQLTACGPSLIVTRRAPFTSFAVRSEEHTSEL